MQKVTEVNIYTDEDYVSKLVKLFRVRNKSRKIAEKKDSSVYHIIF